MPFIIINLILLQFLYTNLSSADSTNTPIQPSVLTQIVTNPTPIPPTPTPTPTPIPLPRAKTLPGGTQVFQTFNNCGPAALSMALSHYGITRSQADLGLALRPYQNAAGDNDDKSVTLTELAGYAPEFGLVPYHRPAGNIDIIKQFIALDIPVLARTWLKPNEDIGHFRVIKGYNDNLGVLIQDDSLQGANLSYTYQDFENLWQAFNYEFLVLVPAEKQAQAEHILKDILDESAAWQQALANSDSAIESDPNNIYAHFNKSVALFHLGRYRDSVTAFETVESRLPSRMLWYQIEPLLSYIKTDQDQAFLTKSQNILSNQNQAYSELHYLRGQIFQAQGQSDKASESFQLANTYNHEQGYWHTNINN